MTLKRYSGTRRARLGSRLSHWSVTAFVEYIWYPIRIPERFSCLKHG